MTNKQRITQNQQGIISIMMTTIMIIVISLIVLGLAQVSRREQRQSTDNQLSSQAFYAAESGINDVISILRNNSGITAKPDCASASAPYDTLDPSISPGVSYSCVLVDPGPTAIHGDISANSTVYNLSSSPSLGQLTFTWGKDSATTNNASDCTQAALINKINFLPKNVGTGASDWKCPYAILRVDLVDVSATNLNRSDLVADTKTVFLVPTQDGAVKVLGSNPNLRAADCSTGSCTYTFTGLSGSSYYARVNGIYREGSLTIQGLDASGTNHVTFSGVVTIDVTGKAQDVLRRIKATVNIKSENQNGGTNAAILSGNSVYKRFEVYGPNTGGGPSGSASPVTDPN